MRIDDDITSLELFKPTIECYVRNRPSYFSATTTGKQYDLMP